MSLPSPTITIPGNSPFKWSTLNSDPDSVTIKLEYNGDILISEDIPLNSHLIKVPPTGGGGNGYVEGQLWANPSACFFTGSLTIDGVTTVEFIQLVVSVIYHT